MEKFNTSNWQRMCERIDRYYDSHSKNAQIFKTAVSLIVTLGATMSSSISYQDGLYGNAATYAIPALFYSLDWAQRSYRLMIQHWNDTDPDDLDDGNDIGRGPDDRPPTPQTPRTPAGGVKIRTVYDGEWIEIRPDKQHKLHEK